ncbi:MAG: UDP-N-acetylmuramoyl-L-alanyl-D-glutamate--2,6-diaminopimelate ligase, partial [Flavobacteriales bacterium]
MKFLKDILYKCRLQEVQGSTNVAIEQIASDSRLAKTFSLFIAVRGTLTDGHKFIDQAVAQGAVAIVCEELPEEQKEGITYVQVTDSTEALGYIASNFYDNPSDEIEVIGVTGTNGKTTTVSLLYQMFRLLNIKTGLLSTVVNKINDQAVQATHTTPDAISLQALLRKMVDQGCKYCFMEASSHAIHQNRTKGVNFRGAVFTNITHDHLDYHETFNEYIKAKKLLFDGLPGSAFALVNNDDSHAEVMVQNTKAKVKTMGLKTMSDYRAKVLENQFNGLHLSIDGKDLYTK